MKIIETLFDTVPLKEPKVKTPIEKLQAALRKDLTESIYKYKIKYNRVYYGKILNFPKGIDKDSWLSEAEYIWNSREKEGIISVDPYTKKQVKLKLRDVTKANQ